MENITRVTANASWESGGLHQTDKQDNRLADERDDRKENEEENAYEEAKEPFRRGSRPHSTPMTLRWLEENYETAEGVCIPRSTLYVHYLDFCDENDTNPVNAASFGKIIRQQFPQITTRRLGTRGQSKYHYYGIGVKESSAYYDVMYSAKGVQTLGEGKKDSTKQIVAYSPRSKLGTLLPPFPDVKDLNLSADVDQQKVVTFVMMYRTHCQRILDTVIRANFDEVQNFLHHFWQGMPPHITPILGTQTLVQLVGACDSILYKAVANVLMPTVLQPFPESLTQVIRQFASQLEDWLTNALAGMPSALQDLKLDLSRRFSQVLRRQLSVNHLVQAARTVVNSPDVMSQMLSDWLMVDIGGIVQQTLYTMDQEVDKDSEAIFNLCTDFEKLLDEQAPLESYVDWLDAMINSCVIKPSGEKPSAIKTVSRQFLFLWTCFGTRVIRDLTLQSAASFGSFHLLHLMLDDYVLYRIECLQADHRANRLLALAKGQDDTASPADDVILPDSSQVALPLGPFITSPVSRYGPHGLFDQHMLDFESHSDCFSSDEDEEEDDDDDDETFLRSPFDVLSGVHGQPLQSLSGSNNLAMMSSAHAGSFLGNSNMKSSDHHPHHQHQHQHHPQPHHQHPFPFSAGNHPSSCPVPGLHHDYFLFSQQHPSAMDQHANSLQIQHHPHHQQHQHPHHQLPHRQPITSNVPHNPHPQYSSKGVPTSRPAGFSSSCEVSAIDFYPFQFSPIPPRDRSHESSNFPESSAHPIEAEAMERKALPYTHPGSAHLPHGAPHSNFDSCQHSYNNPAAAVLSSEASPSFSSEDGRGPGGLKRKRDVTDKMEGVVGEATSTPNLLMKGGLWNQSPAATSFIN